MEFVRKGLNIIEIGGSADFRRLLTIVEGGGEAGRDPQVLSDVICEQSLTRDDGDLQADR